MQRAIGKAISLLWLTICLAVIISSSGWAGDNCDALIFAGDFEAGNLKGWGRELGREYSATIVKEPVRAGKYAARFELHKDDPTVANSRRAELTLKKEPGGKVERWYGFSIFLPDDYERDPTPEIVTQWHASPDLDDGEVWRSPPLAVLTCDGQWQVNWRWDADRIMKRSRPDGTKSENLGKYETGVWTDWVFHVKWSWQSDGLLEAWKNGKKVIKYEGPIGYNDKRGVYFKTGIYKWVWKKAPDRDHSATTRRITYVDEVRIGNEKAAYRDVAPADAPTASLLRSKTVGVKLEKIGTKKVYFTHNGKPLLSFGGLSDFIFYAAEDAYDYKLWADWAAEHGINHVRAYPPLSWKHVEKFTKENGGSLENMLFPYEETEPGSRKFDLTRFNEDYWKRFRRQCEYLQSKGVIIHLLMWNGWQLRASDTPGRDKSDIDWSGHFFNPANNVNSFTDHLGPDLQNRYAIYHSVADGKTGLVDAQKAWFCKLVEMTADLDNVYYDLVHEMKEHYRDWEKTRLWIEQMTLALRDHHSKLRPGKPVILGMDTGGLSEKERDWIFTRPYFNVLIYGKKHTVENAREWRMKYNKPYIPQESWDDDGQKYSYIHPEQRVHTRKYMWKFMMAKCQQMDLYMKPRIGFSSENLPEFPHNYNPNGRSKFEDDALVLRAFWGSLTDYPNLWFNGSVASGPGSYQYVLSSNKEAVAYCSSATAKQGMKFKSEPLKLKNLSLVDGAYTADVIKPDSGVLDTCTVAVKGGTLLVALPAFTDDIAVHIYKSNRQVSTP